MEQINYRVGKCKVLPEYVRQMWWKANREMQKFYQEASNMYSVPVSLTEKEIHTVLRNSPEILENFFKQCKTKKILRETTDLCLGNWTRFMTKRRKAFKPAKSKNCLETATLRIPRIQTHSPRGRRTPLKGEGSWPGSHAPGPVLRGYELYVRGDLV